MKNHTFASLNNRSNAFSNISKSRANTVKGTTIPPSLKLRWLKGAVAQSVEQKTENLCVGGSIPSHTTQSLIRKSQAFFISSSEALKAKEGLCRRLHTTFKSSIPTNRMFQPITCQLLRCDSPVSQN